MIMKNVLAAAEPYLSGRSVRDLVIGISLIGCQLDNGAVGVSYVLRDGLPHGCSAFPYAQKVIGRSAVEIADWIIFGGDNLQRAIASAVLAAASCGQDFPDNVKVGMPFGMKLQPDDTVGMIGIIAPVAMQIANLVKELIVFDEGVSIHGGNVMVHPMEEQPKLLPTCDVVVLSGTTTINGSIDGLLELCAKAREVLMVGASTPMFPKGWQGSRVTRLAGSWWVNEHKNEIFKAISLGCGISYLHKYMRKKVVAV
ncbi:MAG: Rossmann-like domain-containing protein [Desulfosporosinus sp.]|jgi:uncharacterized protein (DUF4213/DUF364 family)